MNMRLSAAVAAFVLAPLSGAAAQPGLEGWTQVHSVSNGRILIERASLEREGALFVIRSRAIFSEPQNEGVVQVVMRFGYDCDARTAALLHFVQYRANGSQVREVTVPAAEIAPEEAEQGSPNDAILAAICR